MSDASGPQPTINYPKLWKDPFILVMVVLFAVAVVCVIGIFITIVRKMGMETLTEQTFGIRLMQITFGMLIGLAVTFLGVVVAWFGVRESIDMQFKSRDWAGTRSKSPTVMNVSDCSDLIELFLLRVFPRTKNGPRPGAQTANTPPSR